MARPGKLAHMTPEQKREYRLEYMRKWKHEHRANVNASVRKRRANNPDKIRAVEAAYALKWRTANRDHVRGYKYGLTADEWRALKTNGCAMCGSFRNLVVDHCHITGKVRGALCTKHNSALGKFGDSPDMLNKALEYLGGHPSLQVLYGGVA